MVPPTIHLGPRVVGVRPDALPPTHITHCDLAANPSSTIRIFSSGVYLRRVAVFTVRTKDSVSRLRSRAATRINVFEATFGVTFECQRKGWRGGHDETNPGK